MTLKLGTKMREIPFNSPAPTNYSDGIPTREWFVSAVSIVIGSAHPDFFRQFDSTVSWSGAVDIIVEEAEDYRQGLCEDSDRDVYNLVDEVAMQIATKPRYTGMR
jgi:hypothetical protein